MYWILEILKSWNLVKISRFQEFKISRFQDFKNSRCWNLVKNSRIQDFKNFKNSRCWILVKNSRNQDFKISRFQGWGLRSSTPIHFYLGGKTWVLAFQVCCDWLRRLLWVARLEAHDRRGLPRCFLGQTPYIADLGLVRMLGNRCLVHLLKRPPYSEAWFLIDFYLF